MRHLYTVENIEDEGGKTKCIHHRLVFDEGEVLKFSERNIFDFGRVINPEYALAEGADDGGLVNFDKETGKRYWMDFRYSKYEIDGKSISDDDLQTGIERWQLPGAYEMRHTVRESPWGELFREMMPGVDLEVEGNRTEDWWEVIEKATGKVLGEDDFVMACRGTSELMARAAACWKLAIKTVQKGGWFRLRDLTPREEQAYSYLWKHGYYSDTPIRMETDEDLAEVERIARIEASLEQACEDGIIPGAMPADL